MHRSQDPQIERSEAASSGGLRRWLAWGQERPGTVLAIYWMLAFVITHLPPLDKPDPDVPPGFPFDKIVHFFGFAGLAFLLMTLLRRHLRPVTAIVLTILIAAVYGVVDELTQPIVGRTTDVWDWVADLVGCGVGLAVYLVMRKIQAPGDKLQ